MSVHKTYLHIIRLLCSDVTLPFWLTWLSIGRGPPCTFQNTLSVTPRGSCISRWRGRRTLWKNWGFAVNRWIGLRDYGRRRTNDHQSNWADFFVPLTSLCFASPHLSTKASAAIFSHPFSLVSSSVINLTHSSIMQSFFKRGAALAARRLGARPATQQVRSMAKLIKFGTDGRAAMLKGVDVLADAVQVSIHKTRPWTTI